MASNKKSGGNTVESVRKLAKPIAESLGLKIWDVRFLKEGAEWYLRIFIDKPEGVGIEDCEAMTRAINDPLDELDPISQSYCLEVCSPGINRELSRPEHFKACCGERVFVRFIRPLEDGRREIFGTLTEYNDDRTFAVAEEESGEIRTIAQKDTSAVRLAEDDFVEV